MDNKKIPDSHQYYLDQDFFIHEEIEKRLTQKECMLIELYGKWLSALENEDIEPYTDAQRYFLKVSYGLEPPVNKLQEVWLKYKKLKNKKYTCRSCAGKGCHDCGASGYYTLNYIP